MWYASAEASSPTPSRRRKSSSPVRSRRYAATVCADRFRSVPSSARNASRASDGDTPCLLAGQGDGDQLADSVQKIHALAGMEVSRVAAADHEKAEARVEAERQHRRRGDRLRVAVEQHGLLP